MSYISLIYNTPISFNLIDENFDYLYENFETNVTITPTTILKFADLNNYFTNPSLDNPITESIFKELDNKTTRDSLLGSINEKSDKKWIKVNYNISNENKQTFIYNLSAQGFVCEEGSKNIKFVFNFTNSEQNYTIGIEYKIST